METGYINVSKLHNATTYKNRLLVINPKCYLKTGVLVLVGLVQFSLGLQSWTSESRARLVVVGLLAPLQLD